GRTLALGLDAGTESGGDVLRSRWFGRRFRPWLLRPRLLGSRWFGRALLDARHRSLVRSRCEALLAAAEAEQADHQRVLGHHVEHWVEGRIVDNCVDQPI